MLQKFKIRPYLYPGLVQTLLPILRDDAGDVLSSGKESTAKEMSFELLVWCDVGKAQILPQRSLPPAISRSFPEGAGWHEDVGPGTVPGVTVEPFLA